MPFLIIFLMGANVVDFIYGMDGQTKIRKDECGDQ